MSKNKLFRDPVHGYISIPSEYCNHIIDTNIFQRLRQIEQTSMRVLYPAAHHDRFIHSLGTFHLATRTFDSININSQIFKSLEKSNIARLKATFLMAALLHDCAHAPFSHTCEKFYDNPEGSLDKLLKGTMRNDQHFDSDYDSCSPSIHEKVSAIMVIEQYKDIIENKFDADPYLAARMIIGCKYHGTTNKGIENCLIELINGPAIDVDKLDYICRDTWASGVNNVTIDTNRLITSLYIGLKNDKYRPIYKKSSMSVIQNVVYGRNFLFQWIYAHHKVKYDQMLLQDSIESIAAKYDGKKSLQEIFSVGSFKAPVNACGLSFFMPTDGDILFLLKQNMDIPKIREWFSRRHKLVPIWKTFPEYHTYFKDLSGPEKSNIRKRAKKLLEDFLPNEENIECIPVETNLARIEPNQLFIGVGGEIISYTDIFNTHSEIKLEKNFLYIYVSPHALSEKGKNEIIHHLRFCA